MISPMILNCLLRFNNQSSNYGFSVFFFFHLIHLKLVIFKITEKLISRESADIHTISHSNHLHVHVMGKSWTSFTFRERSFWVSSFPRSKTSAINFKNLESTSRTASPECIMKSSNFLSVIYSKFVVVLLISCYIFYSFTFPYSKYGFTNSLE
ncbi:unnamed protein product [Cuscuta europaea]|uniref:Uncharacterized protein n=1 Tax=Cuscuta europaea TaxID=41803 RepID=A0A9P0ZRW2_CUSEU|nr:unnamed protein product [Cuscuta europaea]